MQVFKSKDPAYDIPRPRFALWYSLVVWFRRANSRSLSRAIALPLFNTALARRMMEQTRIYKALLLARLLQVGRNEHLKRIHAEILHDNRAMQHICEKLGFQIDRTEDSSVVKAEIILSS